MLRDAIAMSVVPSRRAEIPTPLPPPVTVTEACGSLLRKGLSERQKRVAALDSLTRRGVCAVKGRSNRKNQFELLHFGANVASGVKLEVTLLLHFY